MEGTPIVILTVVNASGPPTAGDQEAPRSVPGESLRPHILGDAYGGLVKLVHDHIHYAHYTNIEEVLGELAALSQARACSSPSRR